MHESWHVCLILQLSMFVDYTWQCMKLPAAVGETSVEGRTSPDSTTTPGEGHSWTRHTLSSRG